MNTQVQDNRFKFNIPIDIIKADNNGWQISGIASTEDKDLQGEIVRQNGLDISELKSGRGLFNYEHRNNPEDIIGMIEDASHTDSGLKVDGYLFRSHKRAQAIAEIMQSLKKDHKSRVQLSIEGKIKSRSGENSKIIKAAKVDRVAITFAPVNENTYVSFAKSLSTIESPAETLSADSADPKDILVTQELVEEMTKAKEEETSPDVSKGLSMDGAGDAPGTLTGGAALATESLDDKESSEKKKKKKPRVFDLETKKAILSASSNYIMHKYPDASLGDVLDLMKSHIIPKFDEFQVDENVA